MQKSIALALLFGSTSATAATPGPLPVSSSTTNTHIWEQGATSIATTALQPQFAVKKTMVTSPVAVGGADQNTGLYGCLRSGNVPMATQGMAFVETGPGTTSVAGTIDVTDQSTATARTFYQTTAAMQGVLAEIPLTADQEASTLPWAGYLDIATADVAETAAIAAIGKVTGFVSASYFECCAVGVEGADYTNAAFCPTTYQILYTNDAGSGTVIAAGDVAGDNSRTPNRLALFALNTDGSTGAFGSGSWNGAVNFNQDFILGAMGQISDDIVTVTNNWCSKAFMTTVTSTPVTYSATEGFNSKTKCSWQVSAPALSAPQFEVKAQQTAENSIQWIEWVGSAADSAAHFIDSDILKDTQAVSGTTIGFNFGIGDYDSATGTFFNPFSQDPTSAATTPIYSNAGTTAADSIWGSTPANGFQVYTYNQNIAGSPGKATFYQNSADNLDFQSITQEARSGLDMGIFTTVLDYARPAYAAYDTALGTFNTDAAAYNEAVDAYNTALEAKENELPVVMVRPCPPTKPAAITGLTISTDSAWTTADLAAATVGVVNYDQQSAGASTADDSKRFGYIISQEDNITPFTFDAATAHAGHVFGRLGQGKMNMPSTVSPWKWTAGDTEIQHMMVSIFPENGVDYNGSTGVLAADESIDIEISSAAYSLTNGFEMPSASATAALALTDKDAAQALVFSAVALAAAVASLY